MRIDYMFELFNSFAHFFEKFSNTILFKNFQFFCSSSIDSKNLSFNKLFFSIFNSFHFISSFANSIMIFFKIKFLIFTRNVLFVDSMIEFKTFITFFFDFEFVMNFIKNLFSKNSFHVLFILSKSLHTFFKSFINFLMNLYEYALL